MSKMVETIKDALIELRAGNACRFNMAYITAAEWKRSYAPALRAEFPDAWWTLNQSTNHLTVRAN